MQKANKPILYVADIHGADLIRRRQIRRNLSFAGYTKVITLAQALISVGNKVIIYSFGSPAEGSNRFYSGMCESIPQKSQKSLKILYTPAIDNKIFRDFFSGCCSIIQLPIIFKEHSTEIVIIYNISIVNVLIALESKLFGKKVFFEYEDSIRTRRSGPKLHFQTWIPSLLELLVRKIASGSICASIELARDLGVKKSIIIPGVISEDIAEMNDQVIKDKWDGVRPLRFIYAGGMDSSKGIALFLKALLGMKLSMPIQMRVCGAGPQEMLIKKLCDASDGQIKFLGLVPRAALLESLFWADVGINPHKSDIHNGGTWPFKVVEYLAACGIVFCSNTNTIEPNLAAQLFLYDAKSEVDIQKATVKLIDELPALFDMASERRLWAIQTYGIESVGVKLNELLTS